ncbi:MAG: hypothetical protein LBT76_06765 [Tannerella sp.]|jgi:hypothetical protein|nr:hypothetical protein [Tannerella sp.]
MKSFLYVALFTLFASTTSIRLQGQPLAGTDDLGRTLLQNSAVGDPKPNRQVGIFYFLCLTDPDDQGCATYVPHDAWDLTEIAARHPEALEDSDSEHWGKPKTHTIYFWGKPIWGYYRFDDAWATLKNMQLLTDAGVDFLIFDTSNGPIYPRTANVVMTALDAIRAQGKNPPKVVFYTSTSSPKAMQDAWEMCYKPGAPFRHPDCWLYVDGKPLIVGRKNEIKGTEFENFFTFREARFPREGTKTDAWSWISFSRPQHVDYNARGEAEMISVSVAQHVNCHTGFGGSAFYGSRENRGRSYRNGSHGHPDKDIFYGYNIQEQWDYALTQQAPFVFVTGWNEWIVTKAPGTDDNPKHVNFFDQASPEYSRDIEPTLTAGLKDNYYMQLVNNIRRYKGIEDCRPPAPRLTVASLDDWNGVDTAYTDYTGDTRARNHPGVPQPVVYTNRTGRNDFHVLKNAWDDRCVYFYAETTAALTPVEGDNWMRLYLDTDRQHDTGWQGYDYRVVKGNTLQRYAGGAWETVCAAEFRTDGNRLMIAVPRKDTQMQDFIDLEYKWSDNMQEEDPLDWYVNGDCAPGGRFNCIYRPALREYSIARYGAKTDGETDNNMLFERVIDAIYFQGGGVIHVPAGRYRADWLFMKPGVELHLEKGAVMVGNVAGKRAPLRCTQGSITGEGAVEGYEIDGRVEVQTRLCTVKGVSE